ncbi:hypothetical protein J2S53_001181 [Actinopolyspora lacussalsi]|nr:hypothetical protein [Actinopolyspora lacussalsi]
MGSARWIDRLESPGANLAEWIGRSCSMFVGGFRVLPHEPFSFLLGSTKNFADLPCFGLV